MAEKFERATFSRNFLKTITRVKNPDEMLAEIKGSQLEKTLGAWDLIIMGIGVIIGAGIFATVGNAAAAAGPAIVVSMIIAAVACIFSALCYSEFAAMLPISGGAYNYTFATLGELAAWMVGWVSVLGYGIGFIAVACSWSNYFVQFMSGFEKYLPSWLTNPPLWLVNDPFTLMEMMKTDSNLSLPTLFGIPLGINLPAILIVLLITAILVKGTKDSAKMAGLMVAVKLGVIALFIIAGAFYVEPANWTTNFAPHDFGGVFAGAFMIFFAYIGFDALATAAEECKNPQKDLPIGIIGSLLVTTVIYILVALVLTGLQNTAGEIPAEFSKAPVAYCMSLHNLNWAAGLISVGSLISLTSVLLVMEMAVTRILFAMSRDHFLTKRFQKIHPKYKTPANLTWLVGLSAIAGILVLNLDIAASLCNYGIFTSFIIVCVAVLILRKTEPDRERPFKVPFSPVVPLLGILTCGGLIGYKAFEDFASASLFFIWVCVGIIIYVLYGFVKNRINENKLHNEKVALKKQELGK